MPLIYVAGSEQGAGKTALATSLAYYLGKNGTPTVLFKPVRLVGPAASAPELDHDSLFYTEVVPCSPLSQGWPLTITTEEVERGDSPVARVEERLPLPTRAGDLVVAEGLDGLIPSNPTAQLSQQLALALDAHVVVVVRFRPSLTSQDIAPAQELFGERLVGVVLNGVTHHQHHLVRTQLIPQIQALGIQVLASIPEDRQMLSSSVSQINDHLEGEFLLLEEKAEELVQHFMVGGWFLDEGQYVFSKRSHKAVIVRADRPDLQMAALESGCACLILTTGQNPIQYIMYQAEQEGVPLLATKAGTVETMEKLYGLRDGGTIHHLQKVNRFAELLSNYTTTDALDTSFGLVCADT